MKQSKRHQKLFSIIRQLDEELQMLGARGDYGWMDRADWGSDTLFACLLYISKFPEASSDMLVQFGQNAIDMAIERARNGDAGIVVRLSDAAIADEKNDVLFDELLARYQADFHHAGEILRAASCESIEVRP